MFYVALLWLFEPGMTGMTVLVNGADPAPIISDVEVDQALQLASSHKWIALATIVVGALVRLVKDDRAVAWFRLEVSPRWRAWTALGLGVVLGILHRLAQGGPGGWIAAVVGGALSGGLAIMAHELVINSLRGGRDIGVPKAPAPGSVPPLTPKKPFSIKPPPGNVVITNKPTEPPPPP